MNERKINLVGPALIVSTLSTWLVLRTFIHPSLPSYLIYTHIPTYRPLPSVFSSCSPCVRWPGLGAEYGLLPEDLMQSRLFFLVNFFVKILVFFLAIQRWRQDSIVRKLGTLYISYSEVIFFLTLVRGTTGKVDRDTYIYIWTEQYIWYMLSSVKVWIIYTYMVVTGRYMIYLKRERVVSKGWIISNTLSSSCVSTIIIIMHSK